MYYGNIKYNDIANGEGVRTSLFVSGCRLHCKHCFNKETWSFTYGNELTETVEDVIIKSLQPNHIKGLSVLGGEPMEPENQEGILPLLKRVKKECPTKDIWLYTGYCYDKELAPKGSKYTEYTKEILALVDVLVDGQLL